MNIKRPFSSCRANFRGRKINNFSGFSFDSDENESSSNLYNKRSQILSSFGLFQTKIKHLIPEESTPNSQYSINNILSREFSNSNIKQNYNILQLMIENNPIKYNKIKLDRKIKQINPLYLKNAKLNRIKLNEKTDEVYYKYNILYGCDASNLIRTYSPKMHPMSASIKSFAKKISHTKNEMLFVFTEDEILKLIKEKCKDIGVELRDNMINKFKDCCNTKCVNRIIDFSECHLSLHSIKYLNNNIIYNKDRISRLNLAKNNIGDGGIEILAKTIKDLTNLVYFNIASNFLTYKSGLIIFEQFAYQQSILELNISTIDGINRNRLTSVGVKNTALYLQKNHFIEILNISGNNIKNEGFAYICEGLNQNLYLKYLNISNNDIQEKGIINSMKFITTTKLESLDISNNPISDNGLITLIDCLYNFPNLNSLNISYCDFQWKGFKYLMNILQNMKRLEILNVSGNRLKNSNFESIKSNFLYIGVRILIMAKCFINDKNALALGESLCENESIKKINISSNEITDAGFQSYAKLFAKNNSIESFDCSNNYIGNASCKEFVKNIENNRCLKKLNLFGNQLYNEIGNLFIEILQKNKTLIHVNLYYNRIQMKIIDEVNKILKINSNKQKLKCVPNLYHNLKNLKFEPRLFTYLKKEITTKASQQIILKKKVKAEHKNYSLLLDEEQKNIDDKNKNLKEVIFELSKIHKEIMEIEKLCKDSDENKENKLMEINNQIEIINNELDEILDINMRARTDYEFSKSEYEEIYEKTIKKLLQSDGELNINIKTLENINIKLKTKEEYYEKLLEMKPKKKFRSKSTMPIVLNNKNKKTNGTIGIISGKRTRSRKKDGSNSSSIKEKYSSENSNKIIENKKKDNKFNTIWGNRRNIMFKKKK